MAMLMKVSMRAGLNLKGVAVSNKAAYSAAVAQLRTPAGDPTSWASWLCVTETVYCRKDVSWH